MCAMLLGLTNEKDVGASAYSPDDSQVTVGVINRAVSAMVKRRNAISRIKSDYIASDDSEQPSLFPDSACGRF
jgi:hypothetical protein